MGRRAKIKTSRKKMEFLRSTPTMEGMDELKIGQGMAVEVNFGRGNAWFPAIVLEEVGFNSFLVECIRSRNDSDDVHGKVTVASSHIRPIPPKLEVQKFQVLDFVEVFHDSCWKKGNIVTIFANGMYGISFPCVKEDQLFSQSEIRPCLVWMNGKWESADRPRCGDYETVDDIEYLPEIVVPLSCSNEKSSSGYTNDAEEKRKSEQKNVFEGKSNEMDFEDCSIEVAEFSNVENGGTRTEKSLQMIDFSSGNSRCHLVSRGGKCLQSPTEKHMGGLKILKGMAIEVNFDDSQDSWFPAIVLEKVCHSSFLVASRQMSFHCVFSQEKADGAQCENVDNNTTHSEIVVLFSCSSTAQDSTKEISSCQSTSNEMDYAQENCISQLDGNVDIVRKEGNGFEQQHKGEQEGIAEPCHQSSAKNVQADMEVVEQELHFTKTSSSWKYIDSLDVFQFLPQNPHFSPLIEHDEATREGLAIGHMLFFATLVEMTSKLRVDKSRKVFDSFLEALAVLETVGFDVKAVVNRVNNLLLIKERKEQLKNQLERIHSEIAQRDGEKPKAEEEINAISEMINELKAKRELVFAEKAVIDSESNLLQMNENRINIDIKNVKLDYETQVAAPW